MGQVDDGTSVCSPTSQVWDVGRPVRGRQRRHPDRHRLQPHPHLRRPGRRRRPADRRFAQPPEETDMLMLDRDIIQGRGFRNVVEDGDRITGFQFQLRNPNYRGTVGQPARRHRRRHRRRADSRPRPAVDPAGPHLHPRRAAGPRPTSAGSSTRPATITVPEARRAERRRARPRGRRLPAPRPTSRRWSSRSAFPRAGQAGHRAPRYRTADCGTRVDLQLLRRHLHLDDPRGRLRRHRRHRRHRHRDPRRGQRSRTTRRRSPAWIDTWHGLLATYGLTADQLRCVGGHRRCGATAT